MGFIGDLLSAEWWNGVGGIAAIIGFSSIFAAVIGWAKTRYQVADAYLEVTKVANWNVPDTEGAGDIIRICNIGGSGALVFFYNMKNMNVADLQGDELDSLRNVLMPGEQIYLRTTKLTMESEMVAFYVSHLDSTRVRVQRFVPCKALTERFIVGAVMHPKMTVWLRRWYRGGDLFRGDGAAPALRWIRISNRRGRKRLVEAADWLNNHGYGEVFFQQISRFDDDESGNSCPTAEKTHH